MVKRIIYSPEAIQNTKQIVLYLKNNWSLIVVNKFINILREKIKFIKRFPNSCYLIDEQRGIRRCVLTKQITLYYKIEKTEIRILSLFDSRQHPDKLKFN
jgi:plasmid stabilization system protein ParE